MANPRRIQNIDPRWKILEHLFDAVAVVNRDRRLVYSNQRFRKLAQIADAMPLSDIDVVACLTLPENFWDIIRDPVSGAPPRVQSIPFSFRGGLKGFAQVFIDPVPKTEETNPDLYVCVLHDITFEIQSRTQIDESERVITELRRRHAEAQFLWRLSTETPIYLEPQALLGTIVKKLKEDLGFSDACFMTIPDDATSQPTPIGGDFRVGSRLREVALGLLPTLRKKTGRNDVFSEETEAYGTFWITSFRPKLEKPFFLLARSAQTAQDSNRRPLLDPLATQVTGWLDNRAVYLSSITDSLTGLFNRRHFDSRLAVECILARERQNIMSLMIVDIDFFKKINDSFGHQIGDLVLKSAATTLRNAIRTTDITARVGGEEFAALLFDTNPQDAMIAAEKVRKKIADTPIPLPGFNQEIRITVSIGIAGFGSDIGSPESVYRIADTALYKAKSSGRNMIILGESDEMLVNNVVKLG
jgi:diguanylate cyclase (GGDEF)-like protein